MPVSTPIVNFLRVLSSMIFCCRLPKIIVSLLLKGFDLRPVTKMEFGFLAISGGMIHPFLSRFGPLEFLSYGKLALSEKGIHVTLLLSGLMTWPLMVIEIPV